MSVPALQAQPLRVIEKSIEDDARVETRYALLSRDPAPRTGRDRTILVLALKDEPGALHAALKPFADRGVNITRVRSEVSRDGAWRYVFVLELDGHVTDRSVVTAVEETRAATRWTKVLGSFPRPARES